MWVSVWWDLVCCSSAEVAGVISWPCPCYSFCFSHAGVLANLELASPLMSLRPLTFLLLPWISSLRHLHGSCPVLLQASFLLLKVRLLGNSCFAYRKIAPLHSLSFHHALFFCPNAYHYFSCYYFMLFYFSNKIRMKATWKQGLFLCQHFVLLTSVPLVLRLAWHVEDSKNICWMSKSLGAQPIQCA